MKPLVKKELKNKRIKNVLNDIVRRIIESVAPEKIILFGSAAKNTFTAESDIDLLVVKKCKSRREIAGRIYQALIGVGKAVDIVVVTPDDLERYGDSRALVIFPALKEGKIIYAA